jgi:DNA-directed RNA polymerase sigma subunit (sigma70/sigma32)
MTYKKKRFDQATHHYPSELSRGNYTLEEIADMMGCTRERVRQIEAMALRKLRKALIRRGIDADSIIPKDIDKY